MEEYIFILLLIAPGFIARAIKGKINSLGESKSDFEKTVISLIYSLPINIMNILILKVIFHYNKLNEIYEKMNEIKFLIKYCSLTIITTIIFSILIEVINKKYTLNIINSVREKILKNSRVNKNYCCWDTFFEFGKEKYKAIKVIKNNEIILEGFVKNSTFNNDDDKEIIVDYPEVIDANRECFNLIKQEYYNAILDIKIQEYDLTKFLEKQNQQTS